jgi:WD40 repeat protein
VTLTTNRPVTSVAVTGDGKTLASGGGFNPYNYMKKGQEEGGELKLWDVATAKNIRTFDGIKGAVSSVAFGKGGKILASATVEDAQVRLWDVATGQLTRTLDGNPSDTEDPAWAWRQIMSVAFSPDGKRVAAQLYIGNIQQWDLATGNGYVTGGAESGRGQFLTYSPDGKTLATAGLNSISLWDTASGKNTATMLTPEQRKGTEKFIPVWSVASSPDGKTLVSATEDGTVKLWDVATLRCTATFKGYSARVRSVAFSPDGKMLASGSDDRTVKLGNPANGKTIATLKGHTGAVTCVAFSPVDQRLASGSTDRTIKLWDVSGDARANLLGR